MPRILIIEDDKASRDLLKIRLEENGYETSFAADAVTAMGVARKEVPDLILLDFGLPGGDGVVVMDRLKIFPHSPTSPSSSSSGADPESTGKRTEAAGAFAFIRKPIDVEELLGAVRRALDE